MVERTQAVKGDDAMAVTIEDPPAPPLEDVQQREDYTPTVPVKVAGPVRTQDLPARSGPAYTVPLDSASSPVRALYADLRRSRAVLVCASAWQYRRNKGSEACPIPANAMLVVTHGDEAYASIGSSTATLTVITEYYAE
jgi:hypothetical protein